MLESLFFGTDHTKPVQCHEREVYCGGKRTKGGDEDEEGKKAKARRGLPFIWAVM